MDKPAHNAQALLACPDVPRSFVLEIAGIDGSGKTTLAAAIAERLALAGRSSQVRRTHSWTRRWASSLAQAHGLTRAEYVGQDAVELTAALEYVRSAMMLRGAGTGPDAVILEPYVVNSAAIAAGLRIGNLPAVMEVYLKAPAPDLTVILDLDPDVALARIRGRPSSDNFVLTEARNPFVDSLRAAFDVVEPIFRVAGRAILRLDGMDSVERNVERIFEILTSLASPTPSP